MTAVDAAVLFDLDGTLIDTAPDFARVLNKMLCEDGCAPIGFERIRAKVSYGARALVTLAYGVTESSEEFEPLRQRLLNYYGQEVAKESRPFPGIDVLLQSLPGMRLGWGIVTNKPSRFTEPLIASMTMLPRPGAVVCPDHVKQTKPDPESLLLACRQIGVRPQTSMYVGDHQRDIEAGRRAGLITVAVRWGYHETTEQIEDWGADHMVDAVSELGILIAGIYSKSKLA